MEVNLCFDNRVSGLAARFGAQFEIHPAIKILLFKEKNCISFRACKVIVTYLFVEQESGERNPVCPPIWGRRRTADSPACHAGDSGGSTRRSRHFWKFGVYLYNMQSINEGILKIPPEQKEKLRDFYGSLKSQVQALEKDGKIPLFEMMRVVKSFEDFDLSANSRARLSI